MAPVLQQSLWHLCSPNTKKIPLLKREGYACTGRLQDAEHLHLVSWVPPKSRISYCIMQSPKSSAMLRDQKTFPPLTLSSVTVYPLLKTILVDCFGQHHMLAFHHPTLDTK
eukprot:1154880-Pelagomonas_calceolata.AAC.4